MVSGWTAEEAFKAEEERYAHFRICALVPPTVCVIHVPTKSRVIIHDRILGYFLSNPRDWEKNFDDAPEVISKAIGKIIEDELSPAAKQRIDAFREGNQFPFLILKNFLSVPMGFPKTEYRYREFGGEWNDKVKNKRQRQMRTIDSTLGGILSVLNTTPAHRFPQIHPCGYDLTTRWDIQEAFDAPQPDMPLRFHQSTVERALPGAQKEGATTALYAVYGAIRNPRRIPIFLLPVDTIIRNLAIESPTKEDFEKTIKMLQNPLYKKEYPRLSRYVYNIDAVSTAGEKILSHDKGSDVMSFDSSLVWVFQPDRKEGIEAINKLRKAIERASWDQAYEIKLARHDVLIVDNLRAMVARSEETPTFFDFLSLPPLRNVMRRWLREMHGFALRGYNHSANSM